MTLDELKKGNRIAVITVALTLLTIFLTILIKSVMGLSSTSERIVALEKVVDAHAKQIAVLNEDVKRLHADSLNARRSGYTVPWGRSASWPIGANWA